MERWLGKIHCGDALEVMRDMPDGCVDLVLTDPPYLVSAGNGGGAFGHRDHLVNTGGFTDGGCDHNFLRRFKNWMCLCSRRQLKGLIEIAESYDCWNLITWAKPNPVPTCNNKYLPDSEYVVHAWSKCHLFGEYKDKQSFYVGNSGKKETRHPNEKPIPLMLKLVRLGSKPGDIILDPFCGTGTTLVAAAQLGRQYIGIDISPEYVAMAQSRLKRETAQMRLL